MQSGNGNKLLSEWLILVDRESAASSVFGHLRVLDAAQE